MVHDLADLYEASVRGTDATIGRVRDFFFDDRSWAVRYVLVDVRNWMVRHDVVIPVESVSLIDWDTKSLDVQLTQDQLRASPGLDARKPVSRQQEIAVRKFYRWPDYWRDDQFPSAARGEEDLPAKSGEDPHLRNTEDMQGYRVWDYNDDLGKVASFILGDSSWNIGYLAIESGTWLHHRSILIPTSYVESISWSKSRIWLRHAVNTQSRLLLPAGPSVNPSREHRL